MFCLFIVTHLDVENEIKNCKLCSYNVFQLDNEYDTQSRGCSRTHKNTYVVYKTFSFGYINYRRVLHCRINGCCNCLMFTRYQVF